MAQALNKLTVKGLESSSHKGKDFKLSDGGGLYLLVQKSGKYWRQKYRIDGKEKVLALGVYPQVGLAEARKKRDEHRKVISEGIDPKAKKESDVRAQQRLSSNTFKAIALEWYSDLYSQKVSKGHAKTTHDRLIKYIFPKLGDCPIAEISAPDLLAVLRELENKGILETASRVRNICTQVFRYAIATERASRNPAEDLKGILKTPKEKHLPAITDPKEIAELLRVIEYHSGHSCSTTALKLAPYLFVRPGELRQAEWKDFDLEKAIWHYKPSKNGLPFEYPLSRQVVQILKEHHHITGDSKYLFHSVRTKSRPMSDATLTVALHRLGYKDKMSVHGFRAMARTVLAERLNFKDEYIEQQLGHNVRDSLGRAYNRTTYFEQRKEMMQAWADYLDGLREGESNVVPLFERRA